MKKLRRAIRGRNVDRLSAEQIFQDNNCNVNLEIYNDRRHIKLPTTDAQNILGSVGEFCGAFYHVPGNNYHCLDNDHCKVGRQNGRWIPPKIVVALVKYEFRDGSDIIIVRYSNHYIKGATKHAEEFFKDDIHQPQNQALRSSISNGNLRKITMYITFQPCHFSVENTPGKSCCDVLLELLDGPRLTGVEICIKPTHIFKAGNDHEHSTFVENGKKGISLLMAKRIEITRMEEADWEYLLNLVNMNDYQRSTIPAYTERGRECLDKEIGKFLRDIKIEVANSQCAPMHHWLVVQRLFDNLSQFCAFYHVFEQGAGNESPCLSERQCLCSDTNRQQKPNVIVVNGTYRNGDHAYEAKFTDCHDFGIKAEEFLCHSDLPCKVTADRDNNIKVITIYTTWLSPDFCSKVLSLCTLLKVLNVSLCIKPSHIYKTSSEQLEGNGKEEIRKLMDGVGNGWKYINITRMEAADWEYLLSLTTMNEDQRRSILAAYSGSGRERLDKEIGEFLRNIKIEIANSRCSDTHCLIRTNEDGDSHLFDDLSQFCAFFHVFKQGEEKEDLCLSEPQCPWKTNVIVVKGESEQHATMYQAKYIDCNPFDIKAEDFLQFSPETAYNNLNQITIYTTWLPCGFHSIVDHLSSLVAVCIKLSHLHGGDDTSRKDFQKEVDALRSNGQITVEAMTEDDWTYLTENLPEANRRDVPHDDRRRQNLDTEINEFLGSAGSESGSNNSQDPSGSSGSGSNNSQGPSDSSGSGGNNRQDPSGSGGNNRQDPSGSGGSGSSGSNNSQGPSDSSSTTEVDDDDDDNEQKESNKNN